MQLHEVAEIKLRQLREEYQAAGSIPADVFQEFRKRLIGLTDVTHSFFDKLVRPVHAPAHMGCGQDTAAPPPHPR